ncbi:MurR/RpiR family transcriptional regulator [Caldibacillus thermoamylovorans]|uniref:MurR/RpiR family transcriptional regulator n=1 Tax=Bacillaceae TaxID=186817 RepID=UPI001D075464|nr:MurR/RpiR family transcriptional regulator [Caldibacillus thermoamylovorans]MCB5936900.1 MurR/RpiR family transcriptional regulator [Bacillus sp. DFI.2.34]MCB7078674.1 MurR/RpiR family transcriptional regulator [Caldibacillus thermoamylovorans]
MSELFFDIPIEKYQTLSESERYVLKYIVKHINEIPSMSIVKLSEEANVSTATIVRLMKKIGYDGFTSFKYSIKDLTKTVNSENSIDTIEKKINTAIKKNEFEVLNTIKMLSLGNIEDAIQKIHHAEKIYVFARGFSEMIANEITIKLQLLGKNCEMHNDPNIIRVISKKLKDTEIAIFVSLSGETKELVDACLNLKMKSISTITLTAGVDSSLANLSEIVLLGYKGTQSFFPDYEVRSRLPLQVISRILLDAYVIRMF